MTQPFSIIECSSDAAWAQTRHQLIGASEAAGIWGESPYCSPLSIYASKVLPVETEPQDDEREWLEIGQVMEPVVVEMYERRTKRKCIDLGRRTVLRSIEYPWLGATMDRLV